MCTLSVTCTHTLTQYRHTDCACVYVLPDIVPVCYMCACVCVCVSVSRHCTCVLRVCMYLYCVSVSRYYTCVLRVCTGHILHVLTSAHTSLKSIQSPNMALAHLRCAISHHTKWKFNACGDRDDWNS